MIDMYTSGRDSMNTTSKQNKIDLKNANKGNKLYDSRIEQ